MNESIPFAKDLSAEDCVKAHGLLVKRIARHLLLKLPASVNCDDLIQAGMVGLIEAARNFDKTKGATFTTYAGIRIRGAMLDEIRKEQWAPRSVYHNSRRVAKAMREVEYVTGRDARDSEVAKTLGVKMEEYHQFLQDSNNSKVYAFDDIGISDDVLQKNGENAELLDVVQKEDFRKKLSKEMSRLPEKEKLVLALYYDEELNLREVGDILGVSESRISQIHSQAMSRLKLRVVSWM